MNERLLRLVSIGFMVLLMGEVWAEPENGGGWHHGMQRGHPGMMHGGPDIDRLVDHMSRRLELDDTQIAAIRNIVDAARPEAEALREQVKANREAIRALDVAEVDYDVQLQNLAAKKGELVTQLTLLHGRVMVEVGAELTDEQKTQLAEGRDRMRKRFRHHGRSAESMNDTTT